MFFPPVWSGSFGLSLRVLLYGLCLMGRDSSFDVPYSTTDYWEDVLVGRDEALLKGQRMFSRMQSPPRCKLCRAPFKGPWTPVIRRFGFKPGNLNKHICSRCTQRMDDNEGGAEIPVSVLYIDVRGSTSTAETMPPSEFKELLNVFYTTTSTVIDNEQGIIDHMAGDGVMALWIPGFVGEEHPRRAVDAGRELASSLDRTGLPVGVGVHTGTAYVGVVGDENSRDFTVLGDTPNTVARISSAANAGEIAISEQIANHANVDTSTLQHRVLDLKGKSEPVPVWVETLST